MTNTNTATRTIYFVADNYYDRRHRTFAVDRPAFCGRPAKRHGKPVERWNEVFDGPEKETPQRNCGKCARSPLNNGSR